jgi:Phosphotransferase enzyme family
VPVMHRYLELSPWLAEAEASVGSDHVVPRLVGEGWRLLPEVAPAASAVVSPLARDPGPLILALAQTPQTFVHSNWKLDNLGTDDDGRTVVLDWEQPGRGAALSDLAWYLAINCRRLPQTKEASIGTYRDALEASGIETAQWWELQLTLSLLGALVQFGWEKALGGYDEELAWWEGWAVRARPLLG